MRIAILVVCVGTIVACNKKIENKRVEKLDFKAFSIAVPAGWNVVTDEKVLKHAPAGSQTLMLVTPPSGFMPSIIIQEIPLDTAGHQLMQTATDDTCRDTIQKAILEQTKTTPGFAKATTVGAFKGCDVEAIDASSPQSARQLSLDNGKLAISILCNRDKKGAPEIDAACVAIANAITPKP